MASLYVAHEPRGTGIDLTPLHEYARTNGMEIRFVFTKNFNISEHPQEAMATAETFAAKFDFMRDCVTLAGGDPMAGVFLGIALAHEAIAVGARSFNALRFVREKDGSGARTIATYLPISIPTGVG